MSMAETCNPPVFVKIPCYVTGRLVLDTDRERIRQKLARFLVEERNYLLSELILDREIDLEVMGERIKSFVDISVVINGRTLMILRGGPGSVVSRETGTLAAARLLEPDYIIPWAVQANLFDCAFMDVLHKKALAYGWEHIPFRYKLLELTRDWVPAPLPANKIHLERQLLYSYDTHG
jgi:hypothetical protein